MANKRKMSFDEYESKMMYLIDTAETKKQQKMLPGQLRQLKSKYYADKMTKDLRDAVDLSSVAAAKKATKSSVKSKTKPAVKSNKTKKKG